ncbi:MAG: MerR family transcriptional regulator [Clostridiales bacterium]|nr:MerR family transcriptional regulator [Clostridiales bacterium]
MKINEVEALAGIAKKNIRFYEEQGLISPRRNPENGYRDYADEDVLVLRRIRLLRKLDVPIDEIRLMLSGSHTVGDGMRRHLISLERQQRNLQQAMELCQELAYQDIPISQLDTESLLTRMETLEQAGTSFHDVAAQDIKKRYIAPVAVTAVVVTFMTALSGLLLWALTISPEDAPPIWFVLVVIGFFAAVGVGCVTALAQRIREIQKGEIDDAKKY